MAITPEYLHQASEVLSAAANVREAAVLWRQRDPAMRVLVLDALDMRDETPTVTVGGRRIYLATSNGHCWTITAQMAEASALILTQD